MLYTQRHHPSPTTGSAAVRIPRFYVEQPLTPGQELQLEGPVFTHGIRVLRLRPADSLHLFNGDGYDYPAQLLGIERHHARVRVEERLPTPPESSIQLHLGLGLSKADHMDFAIQKAVELGVWRISPLSCRRSVARISADKLERKLAHWQGVIIAACEQSGRGILPQLSAPQDLSPWLNANDQGLRLLLDHRANRRLTELTPSPQVTLLTGPEGGITPEERQLAQDQGFIPIRLGPRVLRTETAPLAALAAIQTLWGDLG